MTQLGFRGRLFFILFSFAVIPSACLLLAWGATSRWVLPMVGATTAWDSIGATGHRAIAAARRSALDSSGRAAIAVHESLLNESVKHAQETALLVQDALKGVGIAAIAVLVLLAFIALRVAGHLSRNLSRPLRGFVGWTELIEHSQALPNDTAGRGAPEFHLLRERMREMSRELQLGQTRALEAERGAALRESARQVAHELKNPLTPIRFAVERLRRDAPPNLAETVEVLAVESERLATMARSFAQFGRLPDGPRAAVDLGELARHAARAGIPDRIQSTVDVADDLPMIHGHYEALARALTNVVLNAVDACGPSGAVTVRVASAPTRGKPGVEVVVHDTGCGIPEERLARIWDPYVTSKPGGTGLGLAIARQTILAHEGEVSAESAPGRGTTIRFTLPVTDAT